MQTVLAFSCTHAPFAHAAALDFLADVKRRYKPKTVVCLGDLGDQHAWSRKWKPNPNAPSPAHEDEERLKWCRQLYKLFPVVKACIGNHDVRIARTMADTRIPARLVPSVRQVYDCPEGWDWRRHHEIDGVIYIHGHQTTGPGNGGIPVLRFVRALGHNCVIGHHHTESNVKSLNTDFGFRWGLSAGCLIDDDAPAFEYATDHLIRSALGCGIVVDGKPSFIPMEV